MHIKAQYSALKNVLSLRLFFFFLFENNKPTQEHPIPSRSFYMLRIYNFSQMYHYPARRFECRMNDNRLRPT